LGKTSHDVEEKAARGGACVDRIRKTLELSTLPMEFADQVDEIFDASAQPVEFPNHEGIAFSQHSQG
jgi:hypothetical protein